MWKRRDFMRCDYYNSNFSSLSFSIFRIVLMKFNNYISFSQHRLHRKSRCSAPMLNSISDLLFMHCMHKLIYLLTFVAKRCGDDGVCVWGMAMVVVLAMNARVHRTTASCDLIYIFIDVAVVVIVIHYRQHIHCVHPRFQTNNIYYSNLCICITKCHHRS